MAFYLAIRVGTKIFMYHNLLVPHNVTILTHDASKTFDLQFEAEEEIKKFLFLNPLTIATIAIFSLFISMLGKTYAKTSNDHTS